jgi:hypothetical protein
MFSVRAHVSDSNTSNITDGSATTYECNSVICIAQDFAVPAKLIMRQWTLRKLSDEQVQMDLVRSRCPRAPSFLNAVSTLIAREQQFRVAAESQRVLMHLESTLASFRSLPCIEKWLETFGNNSKHHRFRTHCLLLRGASRTGKT